MENLSDDRGMRQTHKDDKVEDKVIQYISLYTETAYKLGVKDGIKIGVEQKADGDKTILSMEDMVPQS